MSRYLATQHRKLRGSESDAGFTLIEMIVAIVLGGLVAGVITAAIVTSLRVADSTNDELHDSVDASLISSYLYRDAQAAGGTDPSTAAPSDIGVSTSDWQTCRPQDTAAVVVFSFSWYDRSLSTPTKTVATYAMTTTGSKGSLTRQLCAGSPATSVELGRNLDPVKSLTANSSAGWSSTCSSDCSTNPSRPNFVTLSLTGTGKRGPFHYTLTASLRTSQTQTQPSTTNNSAVPLLALGGSCPNLSLQGTSPITVIGNAAYNSTCTPTGTPRTGAQNLASLTPPGGTTDALTSITDPLKALSASKPDTSSCNGGPNRLPVSGVYQPGTYPSTFNIPPNTAVTFGTGEYVFCAGIIVGANASVDGSGGVFFYLSGGTFAVSPSVANSIPEARINLRALKDGAYKNLLVWIDTAQTVTLDDGTSASVYGGQIYAPTSTVNVASPVASNIGGIVAQRVSFSGAGKSTRIGLPISDLLISTKVAPDTLPDGEVGSPYQSTTLVASGDGSAYNWSASEIPATNFPTNLNIGATSGIIAGTPQVAGTSTVRVLAIGATKVAGSKSYALTIYPKKNLTCSDLPNLEVNVPLPSTSLFAFSGGKASTATVVWSPAAPTGLNVDWNTGNISAFTPSASGTFSYTVTVTDSFGSRQCTSVLTIAQKLAFVACLNYNGSPNAGINETYTLTGGYGTIIWSPISWSPGVPSWAPTFAGTQVNATISALPTTTGTWTATMKATDALGASATCSPQFAIAAAPSPTGQSIETISSGSVPHKLDLGDKIVFTYNEPMYPGSILAGLTPTTSLPVQLRIYDKHVNNLASDYISVFNSTTNLGCSASNSLSLYGDVNLGYVNMNEHKEYFAVGGGNFAVFLATISVDTTLMKFTVTLNGPARCNPNGLKQPDATQLPTNMTWFPSNQATSNLTRLGADTTSRSETDNDFDW